MRSWGDLVKSLFAGCLAALIYVMPIGAAFGGYSDLFVFGDSLSDAGNNAIVLAPNVTPVPISGNDFIPTFPYASGRYTNDGVWAQDVASTLGVAANPSLLGGTDYAFGAANTGPLTPNSLPTGLLAPFPPSLETQVAFFLSQHGNAAPAAGLYIVAGGGEDVLQALRTINACNGSLGCIDAAIHATVDAFASNIGNIVAALQNAGAQHIVVWDVPDVGEAPAPRGLGISALATAIASSMNLALSNAIGTDPNIELFDAFGLLNEVIADPIAFGLANVTDACAQFIDCDPSQYLFWDGIHPTSAANPIIADRILSLIQEVPEPATIGLLGAALLVCLGARRRQRTNKSYSPRSLSPG
jgi:outer membrane lipase/esterase